MPKVNLDYNLHVRPFSDSIELEKDVGGSMQLSKEMECIVVRWVGAGTYLYSLKRFGTFRVNVKL